MGNLDDQVQAEESTEKVEDTTESSEKVEDTTDLRVTGAAKTIRSILSTIQTEGWCLPDHLELMADCYGRIVTCIGMVEAEQLIGNTEPVTLSEVNGHVKAEIDQRSLQEIAKRVEELRALRAFQVEQDPRERRTSREGVEEQLAPLPRLTGSDRVETEATPFDLDLWNLATNRSPAVRSILERKFNRGAHQSDPDIREALIHVGVCAEEIEVRLNSLIEEASERLPQGYEEPIRQVADSFVDQCKTMALLAQEQLECEVDGWSGEKLAQYDEARVEARWLILELKNTLLVVEDKIGVNARYLERLDEVFTLSVSPLQVEPDAGDEALKNALQKRRSQLKVLGERIRQSYAARNADLVAGVLDGGEGVMEDLLDFTLQHLRSEGRVHPDLHIQTRSGDWPRELGERSEWVPVAAGMFQSDETGRRPTGKGQSKSAGCEHYIAYVRTAGGMAVRLDNFNGGKTRCLLSEQLVYRSKAQVYVRASALERVRPSLALANEWLTMEWEGRNCFIASAAVLLLAYQTAGQALDPETFSG